MPIGKGTPYGEPGPLPAGAVVVHGDAEARRVLEGARRRREPYPALALVGGDLCRTLGGGAGRAGETEARLRDGGGVRFTVDVGEAIVDGRLRLFVAHLVAHTRLWTRAVAVMNAQSVGRWNLGPRAHPGDGLLDVYEASLPLGQVLAVRSRLHHGAHLPHPGIREKRARAATVELDRPLPLWLDGERAGTGRSISVRADPDALLVVVA